MPISLIENDHLNLNGIEEEINRAKSVWDHIKKYILTVPNSEEAFALLLNVYLETFKANSKLMKFRPEGEEDAKYELSYKDLLLDIIYQQLKHIVNREGEDFNAWSPHVRTAAECIQADNEERPLHQAWAQRDDLIFSGKAWLAVIFILAIAGIVPAGFGTWAPDPNAEDSTIGFQFGALVPVGALLLCVFKGDWGIVCDLPRLNREVNAKSAILLRAISREHSAPINSDEISNALSETKYMPVAFNMSVGVDAAEAKPVCKCCKNTSHRLGDRPAETKLLYIEKNTRLEGPFHPSCLEAQILNGAALDQKEGERAEGQAQADRIDAEVKRPHAEQKRAAQPVEQFHYPFKIVHTPNGIAIEFLHAHLYDVLKEKVKFHPPLPTASLGVAQVLTRVAAEGGSPSPHYESKRGAVAPVARVEGKEIDEHNVDVELGLTAPKPTC